MACGYESRDLWLDLLDRVLLHSRRCRNRACIHGLFGNILLWPFRMLLPYWDAAIHCIGAFGLVVALIAALALLRDFSTADQPTTPV